MIYLREAVMAAINRVAVRHQLENRNLYGVVSLDFQSQLADEIADSLRAALSAPDAGWQTIESAPRNAGLRTYLLLATDTASGVGYWYDDDFGDDDGAGWRDISGEPIQPKYWQPIPTVTKVRGISNADTPLTPAGAAPTEAMPDCDHHWIGGNDGVWCTKCKREFLEATMLTPSTTTEAMRERDTLREAAQESPITDLEIAELRANADALRAVLKEYIAAVEEYNDDDGQSDERYNTLLARARAMIEAAPQPERVSDRTTSNTDPHPNGHKEVADAAFENFIKRKLATMNQPGTEAARVRAREIACQHIEPTSEHRREMLTDDIYAALSAAREEADARVREIEDRYSAYVATLGKQEQEKIASFIKERDALTGEAERLDRALHLVVAQCGIPDAADACRKILATCRKALQPPPTADKT